MTVNNLTVPVKQKKGLICARQINLGATYRRKAKACQARKATFLRNLRQM
jgi:hypothetical protein